MDFVEVANRYRIVFDRFAGAVPYQDGGIATRLYEHGDSGNGDPLYPKTWLYLGGWGKAANVPPFETFLHLYWEEVTWRQ